MNIIQFLIDEIITFYPFSMIADKGCIACHSAVKDKDYLWGKQN